MTIVNKCTCGETCYFNVGDSIQNGVYRWHISCHCNNCNENTEMDGCGIDTVPDGIHKMIIDEEGKWGLKSSASKTKIEYLLKKLLGNCNEIIFQKNFFYFGTQNQLQWIKNKLVEKGISESDLEICKIEKTKG